MPPSAVEDFTYGASDQQFLRLHLPPTTTTTTAAWPVVVIIHGGFWKNQWTIDNAAHMSLAPSLTDTYAAVEVEYRRRDHPGGGCPGTQEDLPLGTGRAAR